MKQTAILCLLLGACSNAGSYNQECQKTFEKFSQQLTCFKEKAYADPRANIGSSAIYLSELTSFGDYLKTQVEQKKVSDTEAQYRFAHKISELHKTQSAEPQIFPTTNTSAPTNSSCMVLNNTVQCHSY